MAAQRERGALVAHQHAEALISFNISMQVNAHPLPIPKLLWVINPLEIVYVDGRGCAYEEALGSSTSSSSSTGSPSPLIQRRQMHAHQQKHSGWWRRNKNTTSHDAELSEQQRTFAFAHGTLNGHLLAGEERFQVTALSNIKSKDANSD